jgi:sugar lactone lactonase YvrE
MKRELSGTRCGWIAAALVALLAAPASASPTRSFVLDSASVLGEGKLDGTSVDSGGVITAGFTTRRTELPGVPSAKSLLAMPDGSAYVGTGNDGKIFRYKDGVAKLFADTKQVLVASLARDAKGTLYAGTLPKGKIFAISPAGQVKEFSSPAGAEHVWALVYDDKQKTLFAATGPQGKVFAIDAAGKAEVYYDSEDSHIMTLARAADGSLYAGTSDRALLLHLRGVGRADVVYDFEGSEITAIALRGDQVAVIANLFPKTVTPPKPATPAAPSGDTHSGGTAPAQAPPPAPANQQAGKGQLYRVAGDGSVERLFTADDGHLTAVEWGDADTIYVGTGKEGHIHRVRVSDHQHALLADVDERQILGLQLTAAKPLFITADAGAIYELERGPASKLEWTSKVLDAGGRARFGNVQLRARGPLTWSARSGNTDKPDASWSEWSKEQSAAGAIAAPSARFLQLRVRLGNASSVVYALEAFYLAQNQPALINEVSVEPPRPRAEKAGSSHPAAVSSAYKLRWKVDNPDNDALRYRLFWKREDAPRYRPLLREGEVFTGTDYSWETDAVPDGYYRVQVEASDELDNPAPLALKTRTESEPILIDNTPPEIPDLRVMGDRVIGKARDAQGPIGKLEYSLDGIEWRLLRADDDLLDAAEESFSLPFSQLPKGEHLVVVRVSDARGNSTARDLHVSVR